MGHIDDGSNSSRQDDKCLLRRYMFYYYSSCGLFKPTGLGRSIEKELRKIRLQLMQRFNEIPLIDEGSNDPRWHCDSTRRRSLKG